MVPKLLHSGGHSLCHSGNGIREWSGNRCMFAIDFPAKKQETLTLLHTVTKIRSHCSVGGKGWGLSSSLFSYTKNAHFRET